MSEGIPDAKMERRQREDELARDIIEECRVQLMLKFRFLDLALWRMELEPLRAGARYGLATDAKRVAIDPPRVIARFNESFDELVRDYLHMVMHCVFRHPFDRNHNHKEAWSLTCDIIVENVAMDMCGSRFESADDAKRREVIDKLKMLLGGLLPNKVYGLVKGLMQTPSGQPYRGLSRGVLNEWRDLFERDEHGAWPVNNDKHEKSESRPDSEDGMSEADSSSGSDEEDLDMNEAGGTEEGSSDDDTADAKAQELPDDAEEDADDEADVSDESDQGGAEDESQKHERSEQDDDSPDYEQEEKEWEDISKEIEMNLETFSKEWGKESGSLVAALSVANRKTYDYTEFLRRFSTVTEEILLNQDEFDYIYYTYGMDLYGNMPLIEPLEYKETDRVREFVIAIDTSGSVRGDLVRRFIEHTFEILKESESYATDVNIHIVQCDTRVQADMKIGKLSEIDALMERFTVRGFGGTDFRPVFDYVDDLRKRGELTDMKGLIYFTDGLGQFPEKPPEYDTAFVFMNDEGKELPPVPPWAMKVVIDESAIERMKGASS